MVFSKTLPKDKEETDYFDSGGNVRRALNFNTHARRGEIVSRGEVFKGEILPLIPRVLLRVFPLFILKNSKTNTGWLWIFSM